MQKDTQKTHIFNEKHLKQQTGKKHLKQQTLTNNHKNEIVSPWLAKFVKISWTCSVYYLLPLFAQTVHKLRPPKYLD